MAAMAFAMSCVLGTTPGAQAAPKKAEPAKSTDRKSSTVPNGKKPGAKTASATTSSAKKGTGGKAGSSGLAKAAVKKPAGESKAVAKSKMAPSTVAKKDPPKAAVPKPATVAKKEVPKPAAAAALSEEELFNRPAAAPGVSAKAPPTLPGAVPLDRPAVAPAQSGGAGGTGEKPPVTVNRGPQPYPGEIPIQFGRPVPVQPLAIPEPEPLEGEIGSAAAAAGTDSPSTAVSTVIPENDDAEVVETMPADVSDPQPFGDASAVVGSRRGIAQVAEAFLPDDPPTRQLMDRPQRH